MSRYRLLAGNHVEAGPDGREVMYRGPRYDQTRRNPDGSPVEIPGDVFESKSPLERLNGPLPLRPKFERIIEDAPPPAPPPKPVVTDTARAKYRKLLERMNVKELQEMAQAEEVEVAGVNGKNELVSRLLAKFE